MLSAMSKPRPQITCTKCEGHGKHALSDELWQTLAAVQRLKLAHAEQVARAVRPRPSTTAMNNRLEELRALNLVKREREGRYFYYSPMEANA